MPSSPEAVTGWELAELRDGAVPPAPTMTFCPQPTVDAPRPAVFEVSPSAGVPDELLAPARAAAQAAGYAAGWGSGIRAARLIADAEAHVATSERERAAAAHASGVEQAITALHHAATTLEQRAVPTAEQIEELIVSSALAIAEALVGQVLRDESLRSHAALTRALSLAPVDEDVTVAISPADYVALGADTLVPQGISRFVAFVEDASLAPGDALASCGATTIDARLSSGLDRVREVLGR
jgi:flagellar assembly protein FliH